MSFDPRLGGDRHGPDSFMDAFRCIRCIMNNPMYPLVGLPNNSRDNCTYVPQNICQQQQNVIKFRHLWSFQNGSWSGRTQKAQFIYHGLLQSQHSVAVTVHESLDGPRELVERLDEKSEFLDPGWSHKLLAQNRSMLSWLGLPSTSPWTGLANLLKGSIRTAKFEILGGVVAVTRYICAIMTWPGFHQSLDGLCELVEGLDQKSEVRDYGLSRCWDKIHLHYYDVARFPSVLARAWKTKRMARHEKWSAGSWASRKRLAQDLQMWNSINILKIIWDGVQNERLPRIKRKLVWRNLKLIG